MTTKVLKESADSAEIKSEETPKAKTKLTTTKRKPIKKLETTETEAAASTPDATEVPADASDSKIETSEAPKKENHSRKNHRSEPKERNERKHADNGEQTDATDSDMVFYLKDLKKKSPDDLLDLAASLDVENPSNLAKHDLVFVILKRLSEKGGIMIGEGTLEILQDGYGFLRSPEAHYVPGPDDIYVSPNQIRRMGIRTGDTVTGPVRAPKRGERYFALVKVNSVNNDEQMSTRHRVHFADLTPLYPNESLKLETPGVASKDFSQRIIDIVTPLGKGQRALIVAPPRTGKTVLLENVAHAITANNPDTHLMMLLVGERPEEVTDMTRSIKGEVFSSTFDEPSARHVQLAEMVIEKAKRLVEHKKDVVILLDSITRLARAYNNVSPSSGKVLSGGVDSNALHRPKRFFGAARNIEEGGSLTIIATALVETGSKMDEVIFEEFKGTGNAEIILDRKIADKRVFPAIDVARSGTRKEDLLVDKATLTKTWVLRRILNPMNPIDSIEFLIDKMNGTTSNEAFFQKMGSNGS